MKYLKEYNKIDFDDWNFEDDEFDIDYSEIKNISNKKYPLGYNGRLNYYYIYLIDKYLDNDAAVTPVHKNLLNKWYKGLFIKKDDCIEYDEIITIVKTNNRTTTRLYNRPYNNLSINIMKNYGKKCIHNMKTMIHSIDDASYGVWFNKRNYNELLSKRLAIMNWVNKNRDNIDGEEFIKMCISIGADPDSVDYN